MSGSRPADHFARLYQSNPDPWGFQTSEYEQTKYHQTLSALGARHFTAGLEVGCSIGILTRMLAPRCDRLLGIDIVDAPLSAARTNCAAYPHVEFQRMQVPTQWPAGQFDLIVFSEVLYFLTPADIDRCAAHVRAGLLPNSTILLVNWLGQTDDPTHGDAAAERFISTASGSLTRTHHERHERYRLDILSAP